MYRTFRDKQDGCIKVMMSPERSQEIDPMADIARPFAIVTGASTGIGYELARECC